MKNEEGVVMMFILNFDYVVDEESDNSTEKISPTSPTKSDQSEYLIFEIIAFERDEKKQWERKMLPQITLCIKYHLLDI